MMLMQYSSIPKERMVFHEVQHLSNSIDCLKVIQTEINVIDRILKVTKQCDFRLQNKFLNYFYALPIDPRNHVYFCVLPIDPETTFMWFKQFTLPLI